MKNKKWLVALSIATCAGVMQAQTHYDVTPLATPELNGTARFVGMGGAMSALGADLSVMGTNPAGIGVYRSNDVALTASTNSVESNALGTTTKRNRLSFDQIGFVYSNKVGNNTPLRYINFGFNYHKYNNFSKRTLVESNLNGLSQTGYMAHQADMLGNSYSVFQQMLGYQNDYQAFDDDHYGWLSVMGGRGGLVDAKEGTGWASHYGWSGGKSTTYMQTTGGVNAYDFNMSFNVQDRYFFGITVGVYDVNYSRSVVYGESDLYRTGGLGASYTLKNWYDADGTGVDVKLGTIIRPIEDSSFRIGLAVHTPTWYELTERYSSTLSSNFDMQESDGTVNNYSVNMDTYDWGGDVVNDYELRTPWRFNLSAGYTIGRSVALDAEYEFADYGSMRMRDGEGYEDLWSSIQNRIIKEDLKGVHTFRVGLESKLLPDLSLRLGYNYNSAIYEKNAYKEFPYNNTTRTDTQYANDKENHTVTIGLGYKYKGFYADMAYLYRQNKSDFYAFDDASLEAVKVKDDYNRVLLTLGYKF
jgi:hypothetical protein